MPASKNVLHNLKQKSETTKTFVAITLAALPAILVGYAQFYMNAKQSNEKALAEQQVQAESKREAASAVASLGKIFSEGKESVGGAFKDLKKVDTEFLKNSEVVDSVSKVDSLEVATSSDGTDATTSDEVIKISQ